MRKRWLCNSTTSCVEWDVPARPFMLMQSSQVSGIVYPCHIHLPFHSLQVTKLLYHEQEFIALYTHRLIGIKVVVVR